MPKFVYHTKNADLHVDSDTETGAIQQIVDFENLIERNNYCTICKSEANVHWNIRNVEKNKKKCRYYEKKCYKCGAAFPYHSNTDEVKKGGLYYEFGTKFEKYVKPATEVEDEKKGK